MSKKGRRPKGSALVEKYDGTDEAKERLKTILATVAGEMTVAEACQQLGVSETRFFQLRDEALKSALKDLELGMPGRPRVETTEEQKQIGQLEAQVRRLKIELWAAEIRTKIAVVMPQVLTVSREEIKKSLEDEGILPREDTKKPDHGGGTPDK